MKNIKEYLITSIIISLIITIIFINSNQIKLSPDEVKNSFCIDKDGEGDINKQSFSSNYVMFLNNECGAWSNFSFNCGVYLTIFDMCESDKIILEQTCESDYLVTKEIECLKGCSNGKCNT